MKPVEIFHIGPQKSATTWIYRCLQEHPQVAAPPKDSIHYFDMFYAFGRSWYETFFANARPDQKLFDPTPSYIRAAQAPARIAKENPGARIVVSLRDPIERAFSHYWHMKKNRVITFEFADVLDNYDLFSSWIEPGFYAEHIERYLEFFPREQILCQRFDDLERDPRLFLDQLLVFYGLDTNFTPSVLNTKVNAARPPEPTFKRDLRRRLQRMGVLKAASAVKRAVLPSRSSANDSAAKMERLADVPPDLVKRMRDICEPEIVRLERLLGIDLSAWRHHAA